MELTRHSRGEEKKHNTFHIPFLLPPVTLSVLTFSLHFVSSFPKSSNYITKPSIHK